MTRQETLRVALEASSPSSSRSSSPSLRKMRFPSRPRKSNDSASTTPPTSTPAPAVNYLSTHPGNIWADGPYQLIMRPRVPRETGASFCATEMSLIHNIIIRGLNSIVRQAPYIPDASRPGYNAQDVRDLLFFIQAWCKNLDHHHNVEETTFFPLVEAMTGIVGLMDDLEVEHEEFHPGIMNLRAYAENMYSRPGDYRWATLKAIIVGFGPALINHLHAEIEFLLKMDQFDDEGLKRCWKESGKVAEKVEDTSDFVSSCYLIVIHASFTYDCESSICSLSSSATQTELMTAGTTSRLCPSPYDMQCSTTSREDTVVLGDSTPATTLASQYPCR